jgi:membrane-associated protein
MPHYLHSLAGSPWVLVAVFAVAGLDAVLPFMPGESTVVAIGVVSAGTGRPHLAALIGTAAAGAYLGDLLSYAIGRRSNRAVLAACNAAGAPARCTTGCTACCTAGAAW